jgi:hypothetical protein
VKGQYGERDGREHHFQDQHRGGHTVAAAVHPVACTSDKAFLRLLVRHDDADREFAYGVGADSSLVQADRDGWTVVSTKNDGVTGVSVAAASGVLD